MTDEQQLSTRRELLPLALCGLAIVVGVPTVANATGLDGGEVPGLATYLATAIGITLVSGAVFRGLILRRAGFTPIVYVMTMTFLALVAIVKFALAPYSIYVQNQQEAFTYSTYLFPEGFTGSAPQWATNAAVVFVLYLAVWALIGALVEHRRPWRRDRPQRFRGRRWRNFGFIAGALVAVGLVAGGWIVLFIAVSILEPVEYTRLLTVTPYCVGIATLLGLAGVAAAAAYQSAYEQADAARNATALASIFWIGAGTLLVYHALWVVFMIVLNATWPFRLEHYGK